MTYVEVLCLAVLNMGMPKANFACDHMETIVDVAFENDIEPETVVALIHYESNWNPRVVSRSNACGLMQVIPKYTKKPKRTCRQLLRPNTNIRVGTKILSYWIHKYARGKEKTGLCAYLAGFRCKGPRPNRAGMRYARKIQKYAKKISRMADSLEECVDDRKNGKDYDYEESGCGC